MDKMLRDSFKYLEAKQKEHDSKFEELMQYFKHTPPGVHELTQLKMETLQKMAKYEYGINDKVYDEEASRDLHTYIETWKTKYELVKEILDEQKKLIAMVEQKAVDIITDVDKECSIVDGRSHKEIV